MSPKAWWWTLLVILALFCILLFNYWGAYQPLSTLVYTGLVVAVIGFSNLVFPFRFLGIRKRFVGAIVLLAGVGLAFTALWWPAPTVHIAQRQTLFDQYMPEYQFYEKHSIRVHAPPEKILQSVRESTFHDMRSLRPLLRVRAAAMRVPKMSDTVFNRRILDSFAETGYLQGGNDREVAMFGAANARTRQIPRFNSLQEFADYHESGGLKVAYTFYVQDLGEGWYKLTTETRVYALDAATRQGMGRYWRLIVPGSGLLRRQWLDEIRKRAEASS